MRDACLNDASNEAALLISRMYDTPLQGGESTVVTSVATCSNYLGTCMCVGE